MGFPPFPDKVLTKMAEARPTSGPLTEEEKDDLLSWAMTMARGGLALNSQVDMDKEEVLGVIR